MAKHEDEMDDDELGEEGQWLREMVDDELQVLFVEDERQLKRGVRRLLDSAREDPEVEDKLIHLLETAVEEGNDDSSASLMATVILGELRSARASRTLARCLAWEEDELLQDAAGVAILRIGAPAIAGIIEALEEEGFPGLEKPAYRLLGQVGTLEDEELRQRVLQFLESRVQPEREKKPSESGIEELFRASALLGDRSQLELMKRVIAEDFGGRHPGIQDIYEMLEENKAGAPFVSTQPPWEARYGWLFEGEAAEARVSRSRSGELSLSFDGEEGEADEEMDEEEDR